MSYDLYFHKDGKEIEFEEPLDIRGGTYQAGGTTEAWLNITYNYGDHFHRFWSNGIRSLYGKTAKEVIKEIEKVLPQLGNDVDEEDYWNPTEGNVKRALQDLRYLALYCPKDAVLNGD